MGECQNAIELIVDGYVSLNDKRALDDLRMQRRKLAVDLKALTGFHCRTTIQQIEEDIDVIEAGLAPQRRDSRSVRVSICRRSSLPPRTRIMSTRRL
ncbi:hypothetical protein [Bradyrhizobium sp. LM2.9]